MLLDNLLDQAKEGRPARVNLQCSVYDMQDRLVYAAALRDLPAGGVSDFFAKHPIPITTPGTYNIKGKSYNAATGEYFTTDWTKLIVLKGEAKPLPVQTDPTLLVINPEHPFGRLEEADKRQITFSLGTLDPQAGPVELRYSVIPYTPWLPRWSALREVKMTQTLPVGAARVITVPYTRQHTVELVVAELWQGGHRIEREERPIGVRNALDHTPPFTNRTQIPSLADFSGPGKNWDNIQFATNAESDLYKVLSDNIDEAKQLTPNIGFMLDINRAEPLPGVYDWDYLTPLFDLAARKGCRLIPWMVSKYPVDWAPVEFQSDPAGCIHRLGNMYGYMVGKYLYVNGVYGPSIIRDFNLQFARRFLNHPGLGGYYFEHEHVDTKWLAWPISLSYHEAYRKQFAQYVKDRYQSIGKLNAAYGAHYAAFTDVQLPDAAKQPRKAALADLQLFRRQAVEQFIMRDEIDAVREADPRRPIMMYMVSVAENDNFLRYIVQQGGMMANGGVHSNFNFDYEYERYNAIPGLRFRMEPHAVWGYDPVPHGYDEMIFGMLGMGGRGLGFQLYLPGWNAFSYSKAMVPGQTTGFDKVVKYMPVMRELSSAEKQHDPIGILELRSGAIIGEQPVTSIWDIHAAIYVRQHYSPRIATAEGDPAYLTGSKIIFPGGDIIDARQVKFLTEFLRQGGKVVMEEATAKYHLDHPDAPVVNALLSALGIDPTSHGSQLPGLTPPHDAYDIGKGQLLVLHVRYLNRDQWAGIVPLLMNWAGVNGRLADSADPDMQMHVLQHDNTYYLATTHRNEFGGPDTWSGRLRFCQPLPAGSYRVTELMSGNTLGVFTPAQLAAGFDAGTYGNLEMKIFRIAPVGK